MLEYLMIEFEIFKSPDTEMLGQHVYYKNLLFFGRNHGDLLFQDPDIIDHHLRLEFIEQGLFCFKNKNVPFYLVNGKRTTGKTILKTQDSITIGNTNILIKNLLYLKPEKKGEIIQQNLRSILADNSLTRVKELIEILEGDLRKLS